ncbi:MAG: hypothetical protein U1E65_06530 [Myxococcota bacterium]
MRRLWLAACLIGAACKEPSTIVDLPPELAAKKGVLLLIQRDNLDEIAAFDPSDPEGTGFPKPILDWTGGPLEVYAFGFDDSVGALGLRPGNPLPDKDSKTQSLDRVVQHAAVKLHYEAGAGAAWTTPSSLTPVLGIQLALVGGSACDFAKSIHFETPEVATFLSAAAVTSTQALVGGKWPGPERSSPVETLIGVANRASVGATEGSFSLRRLPITGTVTQMLYDRQETVWAVLTSSDARQNQVLELDRSANLRRTLIIPELRTEGGHRVQLALDAANHVYLYDYYRVLELMPTPTPPVDRTADYPIPLMALSVVSPSRAVAIDDQGQIRVRDAGGWRLEYRTRIDFPEGADAVAADQDVMVAYSNAHLWLRHGPGDWRDLPNPNTTISFTKVVPRGSGTFLLTGSNDLKNIYDPVQKDPWCIIHDGGNRWPSSTSLTPDLRVAFAVDDYCPFPACQPLEPSVGYWIDLPP